MAIECVDQDVVIPAKRWRWFLAYVRRLRRRERKKARALAQLQAEHRKLKRQIGVSVPLAIDVLERLSELADRERKLKRLRQEWWH